VPPTETDDDFAGTERFKSSAALVSAEWASYEARDLELDLRVALKLLPNADAPALFSFKREFRSLATIVHQNLVALHELISDGATWFFTMEIVDGVDFLKRVRANETIDYDRLVDALYQITDGVSALHELGVLHRDLKPSNVLVRHDGRVAILDFGLTTDVGAELLPSESGSGTLTYMAPEQVLGDRLTPAADWYAVGVMLFEAIAGRPPFTGSAARVINEKAYTEAPRVSSLVADVPPPLDELCAQLLRLDVATRAGQAEILAHLGQIRGRSVVAGYQAVARPAFPFVGRERHLAVLTEAAADVRNGRMTMVHVHGRSGTGKSALISHFLDARRRESAIVLAGRCYEQESVPYKGIDAVIDSLARHLASQRSDEIADLLPPGIGVLARLFPVLERVDAIVDSRRDLQEIPDARELRRQAFAALRELLARIGEKKLLIVHIDDFQWGDLDSAALLTELIRPPAPPRMLLLAAYRSEYREKSACLAALLDARDLPRESVIELEIEPFGPEESVRLALALLAQEDKDAEHTAERIARESAGNPYFIFELARHVAKPGALGDDDPMGRGLMLDDVLWSRVQQLSPKDRELIELLAVSGLPLRACGTRTSARDPRACR
jgi:serine/threonine protein kinase